MEFSICIIDDEDVIRDGISLALESEYTVYACAAAEEGIQHIKNNPCDLVLLDVGLPGMNGLDALKEIKRLEPALPVVMVTAVEEIDTVISAMKSGAYDYILKPIHMDTIRVTIRNALESIRLRREVRHLQEEFLSENLPCFIGESESIQDIMVFIKKVAESPDTPVLIQGETGTGKELLAGAIHYRSPNFRGPMVSLNCASIQKDLIESELFGYEKGAFTGADEKGKKGLIEEAENGTLFLDEIGDLSPAAQAKLLRFLEEKEFYRVGGTSVRKVQTRLVSATNRDLDRMVQDGLFRKDLYFRLSVVKVAIPSLRERKEDIIPLARYFLVEFAEKFKKDITGLSPEAERILTEYEWTGNIRELRNMIERAVLLCTEKKIGPESLDLGGAGGSAPGFGNSDESPGFGKIPEKGLDFTVLQHEFEKHYLEEALNMAHGNEAKAARLLNLNHHTYRYRLKKYTSPTDS